MVKVAALTFSTMSSNAACWLMGCGRKASGRERRRRRRGSEEGLGKSWGWAATKVCLYGTRDDVSSPL